MAARKRNSKKAIPRTKAAFKKEYYDLLTKQTRQYWEAGRYTTPTSQSLKTADRLGELYDAHPDWADQTDEEWGDDQYMDRVYDADGFKAPMVDYDDILDNPKHRKNGDRSAPHGLSKAEEKRVRAQIQQDLVGAFMGALNDYAPSTINKNKIGYGNRLLDAYKSRPGATGFYAIKERYFGGHSASAKARKWLNSVTDARWDTIIRAAAKEAIARHKARSNPKSRKNAMATKKISSFRGDDRRVAKGMMTKGYRYYIKVPRVPGMYAKTIKMATELIKDFNLGYGSRMASMRARTATTFGIKGAKVYKLVK